MRKTLVDLVAWDGQARFVIPRWQRHYEWDDKEVRQMWMDWENDCAQGLKHFYGVMLFRPVPNASVNTWEIVDGQQRMTTFFLYFVALRYVCQQKKIDFSELNSIFTVEGSNECRLVLQEGVNEDREIINSLLTQTVDRIDLAILEDSLVYKAYRYFITMLESKPAREIPVFVYKVLENVELVILTIDEADDARRIFEALNSRGKQVEPEELVSNMIKFISTADEELNERSRGIWNYVANIFDRDDLSSFLDVFGKRNGQDTDRGTVFEEIRFEVEAAKKANQVRDWLREFQRAAENYRDILSPDDSKDPIQRLLKELQRLRVPKLNPFLLALLENFRATPASEPLIHNILSAVVRLLVTLDRPSYRLEKFAERACDAFYERAATREARLIKVIALVDAIWIDDETFHHAFTMKSIYGPGAHLSRLRYYLEKLEQKISEQSGMPFDIHFGSQTTVEHIMPQTLDEGGTWKTALRFSDPVRLESQHKALVHTIGNLTVLLTKDNPAAGNMPYAQKREFYLHPDETLKKLGRRRKVIIGSCALNRYFENVPVWNFQAIATRSQYLAALALQIWNKENWNTQT